MSKFNFHLKAIRKPSLKPDFLEKPIRDLDRLTSHLESGGSIDTPDQVAALRGKVWIGFSSGSPFNEYTAITRRESLLLSLYLMDLSGEEERKSLPPFDEEVADSILHQVTTGSKRHLRRQATLLFFMHFGKERLPALKYLARQLKTAWAAEDSDHLTDEASRVYCKNANLLFRRDAPTLIARERHSGETVEALGARFGISRDGEFQERLYEQVILNELRKAPGKGLNSELVESIIEAKNRRLGGGVSLGSSAVRILVERSISEFGGKVPNSWTEHLITFACDPRFPKSPSSAVFQRWWGWASQAQKNVAITALTKLTLLEFISLLKDSLGGTGAGEPFRKRAEMLLKIFELGKVIDARLVVNENIFSKLDRRTKNSLQPFRTSGGPQHTSFICLKCIKDIYLVEGTHSFALRGYCGPNRFPIGEFWEARSGTYFPDSHFRTSEHLTDIYQRHHNGDWLWDFNNQLRPFDEWVGL